MSGHGRHRRTGRPRYPAVPDACGYFGPYGGRFVPETLMRALYDLEQSYARARRSRAFKAELAVLYDRYAGRPTPLFEARRFGRLVNNATVLLKREDLAHTGSHKINNTLGQTLLARRMGKTRVIAETGAGQHGVATATAASLLGLRCDVYMGTEDMRRQELNVMRMRLLGARVIPVSSGTRTLKDAINEAMRDWVGSLRTTFYVLGSVMSAHPYPMMVRDFQTVIGREARHQLRADGRRLPGYCVACVGGGSNAIGLFHPFLNDAGVRMIGVEAAGLGLATGHHSATLTRGRPGILHGMHSLLLQDAHGQVHPSHSIAPGLDYPGVGPEHSFLKRLRRVEYHAITDRWVLEGFRALARTEGILPALESSHALGYLLKEKQRFSRRDTILVCLSGRGDKDVGAVMEHLRGRV